MADAVGSHPPVRREPDESSISLLYEFVGWFLKLFLVLLLALVFSIVVEWIGMAFFWPEQGVNHSRDMLTQELSYLKEVRVGHTFVGDEVNVGISALMARVDAAIRWSRISTLTHASLDVVRVGAVSAINIIYVFTARCMVMMFSMPTFVIFGLAGFVRGLMGRELRRWGGDRESSGLFHLYRTLMPLSFVGVWFIYLSSPVSINPFWLVGPASALFGFLLMGSVYRLKKYV